MGMFIKAMFRSFWTTLFVALVSSGCLGLLAVPAIGSQLGPLVCDADETMVYETYSYNTGGESGTSVDYFCEVNGDRREVGFGPMIGYGGLIFYSAIFVIVWPLSTIRRFSKMRSEERLTKYGIPAVGRIQSVSQTNVRINDRPVLKIDMLMHAEGYPPYDYSYRAPIPEILIPQMQPGNTLNAKVDPDNLQNVLIDLNNLSVSQTSGGSGDTVGRLRELKSLYDQGLITAQEYEEKKDEILNRL